MATTAKDALMFDDVNLSQYLTSFEIQRPLMPEIDLHTVDVPGLDGVMISGRRLKSLYIDVVATLNAQSAASVATARHALSVALNKPVPKRLILPDDTSVFYNAILQGPTGLSRLREFPKVTLRFVVPDASAWSVQEFSASVDWRTKTVTIGGNAPTYPRFALTTDSNAGQSLNRYTAPSSYFLDNESLSLIGIASGALLKVDMQTESSLVGTTEYFPNGGSYWQLGPGENGVNAINCSGTMHWRERWV